MDLVFLIRFRVVHADGSSCLSYYLAYNGIYTYFDSKSLATTTSLSLSLSLSICLSARFAGFAHFIFSGVFYNIQACIEHGILLLHNIQFIIHFLNIFFHCFTFFLYRNMYFYQISVHCPPPPPTYSTHTHPSPPNKLFDPPLVRRILRKNNHL